MTDHERPRRARGELRRQQLIDAAAAVILEHGVSAATHRAIAARAGVPAASTTYFFPSIDALIGEALTGVLQVELKRLDRLQQRIETEELSTSAALDAFVELAMVGSRASIAAQFEMYVAATRRPALQEHVCQVLDATRRAASIALRSKGVTDPAAAQALTAMCDGFALHHLAHSDASDADSLRQGLRALLLGFQALALRV